MEFQRRGVMLVIASPSGAGKSSISRALFGADPTIRLSVSVTTRARRTDEVDGKHYHFIDVATFKRMQADGELLESAEVHGNYYGTPRAKVEEQLAAGNDILFDIDYQGTLQLYRNSRKDMVTVFILPPSAGDLEKRLHSRAQDSDEVIRNRMSRASHEMSHWAEYDYIVINRDVDDAFAEVQSILKAERLKRERRTGLVGFVRGLQEQLQG